MAAPSASAVEIAGLLRAAAVDAVEGRTTEVFFELRRRGLIARAIREGLESEVTAALKTLARASQRRREIA